MNYIYALRMNFTCCNRLSNRYNRLHKLKIIKYISVVDYNTL